MIYSMEISGSNRRVIMGPVNVSKTLILAFSQKAIYRAICCHCFHYIKADEDQPLAVMSCSVCFQDLEAQLCHGLG